MLNILKHTQVIRALVLIDDLYYSFIEEMSFETGFKYIRITPFLQKMFSPFLNHCHRSVSNFLPLLVFKVSLINQRNFEKLLSKVAQVLGSTNMQYKLQNFNGSVCDASSFFFVKHRRDSISRRACVNIYSTKYLHMIKKQSICIFQLSADCQKVKI